MSKFFNLLERYHSDLPNYKLKTFKSLYKIYKEINKKVNLISRKDFENFYLHHIIHSLSILKFNLIKEKKLKIIDLGTGGGLPGIPLSIVYEKNDFILVDSIKKKIQSIDKIINHLNIKNVKTINDRAENLNNEADIIVCRSVSSIDNIIAWSKNLVKKKSKLILLKGGNVNKELKNIRLRSTIYKLDDIYSENYFLDKKIIEIYI